MQYTQTKHGYFIHLQKDEEMHMELIAFCKEKNIQSGVFHGIGAVLSAELGFYHLETKEYAFQQFNEPMEIVSLTGNVALVDGEPFMHIHGVFGDTAYKTVGGHVKEAIVGATCELHLTDTEETVERAQDDSIGLKLWNLDDK